MSAGLMSFGATLSCRGARYERPFHYPHRPLRYAHYLLHVISGSPEGRLIADSGSHQSTIVAPCIRMQQRRAEVSGPSSARSLFSASVTRATRVKGAGSHAYSSVWLEPSFDETLIHVAWATWPRQLMPPLISAHRLQATCACLPVPDSLEVTCLPNRCISAALPLSQEMFTLEHGTAAGCGTTTGTP